jgi:RNA 3'-terminal phosphate cyclase
MTEHLLTNIWLVERFLEVNVRKWGGKKARPGRVEFLNE